MILYKNDQSVQQRIDWLYDHWKGPIPIEQAFDPYNDLQKWYPIGGFNGYEISDHGNVRSMKNFKRYQFGTLCRHTKKGLYELSTDNNERVDVSLQQIIELSEKYMSTFGIYGYPRGTCTPYIESRNRRMFVDFEKVSKNKKEKRKPVPIRKEETYFPKFSVIPDRKGISPIYFENDAKGDLYGR